MKMVVDKAIQHSIPLPKGKQDILDRTECFAYEEQYCEVRDCIECEFYQEENNGNN